MKAGGAAPLGLALVACAAFAQGAARDGTVTVTKPNGGCDVRQPQAFFLPPSDPAVPQRIGTVTCVARTPFDGGTDYWLVRLKGIDGTRYVATPAMMRPDSAIDWAKMQARDAARDLLLDAYTAHVTRCDSVIVLPLPPGIVRRSCA